MTTVRIDLENNESEYYVTKKHSHR